MNEWIGPAFKMRRPSTRACWGRSTRRAYPPGKVEGRRPDQCDYLAGLPKRQTIMVDRPNSDLAWYRLIFQDVALNQGLSDGKLDACPENYRVLETFSS